MNSELFFNNRIKEYKLDKIETWKTDSRETLIDFFEPVLDDKKYYMYLNDVQSKSNNIRIFRAGETKNAIIDFVGRRGMYLRATFKGHFYEDIKEKLNLPDAREKGKDFYMQLELKDLWNVLCIISNRDEYLIGLKSRQSLIEFINGFIKRLFPERRNIK